eukprot:gene7857-12328_t
MDHLRFPQKKFPKITKLTDTVEATKVVNSKASKYTTAWTKILPFTDEEKKSFYKFFTEKSCGKTSVGFTCSSSSKRKGFIKAMFAYIKNEKINYKLAQGEVEELVYYFNEFLGILKNSTRNEINDAKTIRTHFISRKPRLKGFLPDTLSTKIDKAKFADTNLYESIPEIHKLILGDVNSLELVEIFNKIKIQNQTIFNYIKRFTLIADLLKIDQRTRTHSYYMSLLKFLQDKLKDKFSKTLGRDFLNVYFNIFSEFIVKKVANERKASYQNDDYKKKNKIQKRKFVDSDSKKKKKRKLKKESSSDDESSSSEEDTFRVRENKPKKFNLNKKRIKENTIPVKSFLDEGADVSYVSNKLLERLISDKDYVEMPYKCKLTGFNGAKSEAKLIKLLLNVNGYSWKFVWVVDSDDLNEKNKTLFRVGLDLQLDLKIKKSIPKELLGFEPSSEENKSEIKFFDAQTVSTSGVLNSKNMVRLKKALHRNKQFQGSKLSAPKLPFTRKFRKRGLKVPQYPLPRNYLKHLKEYTIEKLQCGQIRVGISKRSGNQHLKGQCTSPIWITSKLGSKKLRVVDDLRRINKELPELVNTLPKIAPLNSRVGKLRTNMATKIDLSDGFQNILLHPDDIQLFGFMESDTRYEYTTLPQGMKLREVVLSCDRCRKYTNSPYILRAPFKSHIADYPMESIVGDVLFMNQEAEGRAVIVIVDVFRKFVWLKSVKDFTAKTTSEFLFEIYKNFGIPSKTKFDQGTNFLNRLNSLMAEKILYNSHFKLTADHQANGISERYCRSVLESTMKNLKEKNWTNSIPLVQFSMNTRILNGLEVSPFELMFGRSPFSKKTSKRYSNPVKARKKILRHWKFINDVDRPKSQPEILKRGDHVMVKLKKDSKMSVRFIGPLEVSQVSHNKVTLIDCNQEIVGVYPMTELKKCQLGRGEKILTIFEFENYERNEINSKPVEIDYSESSEVPEDHEIKESPKKKRKYTKSSTTSKKVTISNLNSSSKYGEESRKTIPRDLSKSGNTISAKPPKKLDRFTRMAQSIKEADMMNKQEDKVSSERFLVSNVSGNFKSLDDPDLEAYEEEIESIIEALEKRKKPGTEEKIIKAFSKEESGNTKVQE